MHEQLLRLVARIADPAKDNDIGESDANAWGEFGAKLGSLVSFKEAFHTLPDKTREELLQRRIALAQERLANGQKFAAEGAFEFALACFEDGCRQTLEEFGSESPLTFQLAAARSDLLVTMRREDDAIASLKAMVGPIPDEIPSTLSQVANWYASTQLECRHLESALEGYRYVLRRAGGHEKSVKVVAAVGIAVTLRDLGHYAEAEMAFSELLEFPESDSDIIPRHELLHETAAIQIRLKKYTEARANLAQALLKSRAGLPGSRPTFIRVLETAAFLEHLTGNQIVADGLTEELRAHASRTDPAWMSLRLHDAERSLQQPDGHIEALTIVSDVQTHGTLIVDRLSAEYALLLEVWAQVADRFGKFRAERWALKNALAIRRVIDGVDTPETAQVFLSLASLELRDGHVQHAVELAAAAQEVLRMAVGTEHRLFAKAANTWGRACLELGAFDDATKAFQASTEAYAASTGIDSRDYWISRSGLGCVYLREERFEEAEAEIGMAVAELQKLGVTGFDRQVTLTALNHSSALISLGRYSEAETIFQPLVNSLSGEQNENLLLGVALNQQCCVSAPPR